MQFTISGYSTALFATWYFIDELSLLFDAGDGVISNLLQKSGKIKHIFISHADRDHLTGLLQLNQLNARPGFPKIYYPKDSGSIEKLEQFSKNFDRQVKATEWIPLSMGKEVEIKRGIYVSCFKNSHVQVPDAVSKSFSYLIQQSKRKLKEEYLHLTGAEIRQLRTTLGDDAVTVEIRENMVGYSGDTPVENFHIWNNTQTLIHEATFLYTDELNEEDERTGRHSVLEDVLRAAANIRLHQLILGHFRYAIHMKR